jgi:hypothetical protein
MAGCFDTGAQAAKQVCHRSSDDSQPTSEDCPYQIHETSPAEPRFETGLDALVAHVSGVDSRLSTLLPASRITAIVPPVVDEDYFHKLTVLLV